MGKRIYRLVLVDWVDNFNTDSYYLNDLMNARNFRSVQNARKWATKYLEKIKRELVDKELYASDLYIEEWEDEWITNEWLFTNLWTKGATANV